MKITDKCLAAFTAHVLAEFPKEACGIVVRGRFKPLPNIAENPTQDFDVDPIVYTQHEVQAVLHSHPIDPNSDRKYPWNWFSHSDVEGQIGTAVPWGVVSTDGVGTSPIVWRDDNDRPPLIGRTFVHGVDDCYSLIRDWFKQERGIVLKDFARGMNWWKQGNLYEDNFMKAGFKEIPLSEATVGDCLMFKYGTRVINHAAVITGPSTILHHLFSLKGAVLSGEEDMGPWMAMVNKAVRYVGEGNGKKKRTRKADQS